MHDEEFTHRAPLCFILPCWIYAIMDIKTYQIVVGVVDNFSGYALRDYVDQSVDEVHS